MKLFIDTWGWLTLYDKQEKRHQDVALFYQYFRNQTGQAYTTDYVLDETFTLLFKRLPFVQAKNALQIIEQMTQLGYLKIEWMTLERFTQTKLLRLKFQDKPTISFTDLSSMVVMTELDISMILTEDAHFTHVGLGFQRVPTI